MFVAMNAGAAITRGPVLQPTTDLDHKIGVMWRTGNSVTGTIHWGVTNVSENTASTSAGTEHFIELTSLSPGTTYKYQVVADGTTTPEYTFRTSSSTQERRIIVLSDVHAQLGGWQTEQGNMVPDMLAFDPDLIVMTGDVVQLGNVLTDYDALFATYKDLFAGAIAAPIPGNHEWAYDTNLAIYTATWSLPQNCPAAPEKNYYFGYGGVRWVAISNGDYSGNETWVQNALTSTANFRIAGSHYPIYLSCSFDDEMAGNISADAWKVSLRSSFEATGTDLHLSGHRHLYHRTFPVLSTLASPACTPAIGTGWGGPETSEPTNYTDPLGTIYLELSSMWFIESLAIYQRPFFAAVGPAYQTEGRDWVGYTTIAVAGQVCTVDTYVYSRDGVVKKRSVDHFVLNKGGASTHSISGTVTDGVSPVQGVRVETDVAHSALTNASGQYTIVGLADGNYTVTPSKAGYTFAPVNRSVSVSGSNVTGVDFTGTASGGGTVVLQDGLDGYDGVEDVFLREAAPTTNYGADVELRAFKAAGADRVFLVRFDLSSIASGAIVSNAVVELNLCNRYGSGNLHFGVMNASWTEMGATWNTSNGSAAWPGGGAAANAGEFSSIAQPAQGWVSINVTAEVQAWVDSTPNNGFFVWADGDIQDRFWSSEYAVDAALRPKLTVTYTAGAPDLTPPTVTLSTADITGTMKDANAPSVVTVGGADVPVSGVNWTRPNVPFSSGVPVMISATDTSGNTRQVNLTVAY
jgi:hypothetical protein